MKIVPFLQDIQFFLIKTLTWGSKAYSNKEKTDVANSSSHFRVNNKYRQFTHLFLYNQFWKISTNKSKFKLLTIFGVKYVFSRIFVQVKEGCNFVDNIKMRKISDKFQKHSSVWSFLLIHSFYSHINVFHLTVRKIFLIFKKKKLLRSDEWIIIQQS